MVWDIIVVSTLAQSYVDRAATDVGAVAEMAAERKTEKYHNLSSDHIFQPIAMENLRVFSSSSLEFLGELGRRLGSLSGEEREACFLFQRLSVAIHWWHSGPLVISAVFILSVFNPWALYTRGYNNNNNNNNNNKYWWWFSKGEWRVG